MNHKISRFNAADYLDTVEARDEFMLAALETDDADYIADARATVAYAAAMAAYAVISREDYDVLKALADY